MVEPLYVSRPHLVRTLDTLLQGSTEIVAIEGSDGIGRSSLLREFNETYRANSFLVEVSGTSPFAYDESLVGTTLASLLSMNLRGRQLHDDELRAWRQTYQELIAHLNRRAQRDGVRYYFILDGLTDIPEEDSSACHTLVRLLPFGLPGFRFLISAELEKLHLPPKALERAKTWQLPYLNRDDLDKLFGPLHMSEPQLGRIYEATGGIPAHMASVFRNLASGVDADLLLDNLTGLLSDSFAREWRATAEAADDVRLALAILAFARVPYSLGGLAKLVGREEGALRRDIAKFGFLRSLEPDSVFFISEAFRKFAAERLSTFQSDANDRIIDELLASPDDEATLTRLPTIYRQQGRLAEVLEFLSPDRFARLCARSPSLQLVQEKATEAIEAAKELNNDGELLRFTLQKCIVEEVANTNGGVAEVTAITALGDLDGAMAIANSSSRIELRFRQLVAIARVFRERRKERDPALLSQIRELYAQLEPQSLGAALSGTVADLFAVAPEMALDLLGRAGPLGSENALDWTLVGLSIRALLGRDDSGKEPRVEDIQSRITHYPAKKLSLEAGVILGGYDADRAIREAESLQSTADKLYILQKWMVSNYKRPDAAVVLEYGIQLAIQATGYSANAQVYRELAICLPYITSEHTRDYFIGLLDGQQAELERVGPWEDVLRLRLTIAAAQWSHERPAATGRLTDAYLAIQGIPDAMVKVGCFARLLASLAHIDPDGELERSDGLHGLVRTDLLGGMKDLLLHSGDHLAACRPSIRALARAEPELAFTFCRQLNLEWRRDQALLALVESNVAGTIRPSDVEIVSKAIDTIKDPRVKDDAIDAIVAAIRRPSTSSVSLPDLAPLVSLVMRQSSLPRRTFSSAQVYATLCSLHETTASQSTLLRSLRNEVMECIEIGWQSLDNDWDKLYLGFDLVVALASADVETARRLVNDINQVKAALDLLDREIAEAAIASLFLAGRAFAGLAHKRVESPSRMAELIAAIDRIESMRARARLLADLAIRCHAAERIDLCEEVVQQRLAPLLQQVSTVRLDFKWDITVLVAPALYLGARATATTMIADLPATMRDEAWHRIGRCLLRGVSPWDPYEWRPGCRFDVTYEQACGLVELMARMEEDAAIYSLVGDLIPSLTDDRARATVKAAQRAEIARQIEHVIKSRLPAPRFIQHLGYSIVARGQVGVLGDITKLADLIAALESETTTIPNTHDRLYILITLASITHNPSQRRHLLDEVDAHINELPLVVDRADLLGYIAREFVDRDRERSEDALRRAWELVGKGQGDSVEMRRRSLVNLACQYFPEVAGSLASLADDDPAKQSVDRELRVRRISNGIASRKPRVGQAELANVQEWSTAAWDQLGRLLAGRSSNSNPAKLRDILDHAARQPMSDAYPIIALYIENALMFHRGKESLATRVAPLLDACMYAASLAFQFSSRSEVARRPLRLGRDSASGVTVLGAGDHEVGVEAIRAWLLEARPRELLIVDPFFKPSDIGILALIKEASDETRTVILTGRDSSRTKDSESLEGGYRETWRRLRDDDPPDVTIVFCQTRASRKCPFHDRWWLGDGTGLACGTSLGGMGLRLAEIRRLTDAEVAAFREQIEPFAFQQRRDWGGERLDYLAFNL